MDGELGALHGGQLSGDAEAQAEMLLILAGGVGLVEAVEYPLFFRIRDPWTFVPQADGQGFLAAGGRQGLDRDLFALGGIGQGIVQQDGQDLGQALGVGQDLGERVSREI